jgi:hypothetical protein
MSFTLVPEDGKHPKGITPNDIQLADMVAPLRNSGFEKMEIEGEAVLILRYYQEKSPTKWKPIRLYDLHDFGCSYGQECHMRVHAWHLQPFERLVIKEYIVLLEGTHAALTVEFIDVCKEAADRNKR